VANATYYEARVIVSKERRGNAEEKMVMS